MHPSCRLAAIPRNYHGHNTLASPCVRGRLTSRRTQLVLEPLHASNERTRCSRGSDLAIGIQSRAVRLPARIRLPNRLKVLQLPARIRVLLPAGFRILQLQSRPLGCHLGCSRNALPMTVGRQYLLKQHHPPSSRVIEVVQAARHRQVQIVQAALPRPRRMTAAEVVMEPWKRIHHHGRIHHHSKRNQRVRKRIQHHGNRHQRKGKYKFPINLNLPTALRKFQSGANMPTRLVRRVLGTQMTG